MKILYFDCFSGISGDMIIGALLDAGLDLDELRAALASLDVPGYTLGAEKTSRNSITGTKFNVTVSEEDHAHRHLKDIVALIDDSRLSDGVKQLSKQTFRALAAAEASIHGESVESVHFHEVGGVDSIIDIVGSFVGLEKLGIEAVYASRVHLGTGFVRSAHGKIPVPAPATLALLRNVPVYSTGITSELVTPTGAAVLVTLAREFGNMPRMTVARTGYGAGSRELEIPNLLRVCIGEAAGPKTNREELVLVETNIDDMNPQIFDHVSEKLFAEGCLDVYLTPVQMKKNRPATVLSVLARPDALDEVLAVIFAETTTLGVRIERVERAYLERELVPVATGYGTVTVKVAKTAGGIANLSPEYEECRAIAVAQGLPLKDVYDEVKAAARRQLLAP
jgi:uncharacterized protein (TIGR00299 family) protein